MCKVKKIGGTYIYLISYIYYMPKQATSEIGESPICGICGNLMVFYNLRGENKCEICEYFFGTSSRINTCSRCRSKFGRYKVVEERFLSRFDLTEEGRRELNQRLCPNCRRESPYFNEIRETLVEKIKYELEQENFTGYDLASQISDLTPKNVEFIRFCSGERSRALEELIERQKPFVRGGIEMNCALCGKPIYAGQDWFFECPPGEDFSSSAKCKYFHHYDEPPLDCWRRYDRERSDLLGEGEERRE